MKSILIPVDFSDTSATALRFGTYLAEVMDLNLRVVHVFDANFSFAQAVSIGAMQAEKERQEEELTEFTKRHAHLILATFQGNLKTLPSISTEVVEGFPFRVIRTLSEREDIELVVMGGLGAGRRDNPSGLFGGVAHEIGLNGGCPVILLPPGYGYPTVGSLAIAFGEVEDIGKMGSITRRIIKVLRPEVRFVHVARRNRDHEWKNDEKFLELALGPDFPSYTFGYDALPSGPVAHRLLDYARAKEIGLLVVAHRKRNLWGRLFSRSWVKQIVNHCDVPLLIVPFRQVT